MKPKVALKIKEVEKQLKAGFLAVVEYLNGWLKSCRYQKRMERVSPKDNFPLPNIDMLVDNTTQHSYFSFMDGFSRYNQIKMALQDVEKTTFITTWGMICYKVMPFRLKNVRATYECAMIALFHDMMRLIQ
ncbi:hypothetical protein CR513_37528, partial [Mucuna pruriens]